ncbi:MAG: enoyl-CoA hydratase/isomerase family protein [Pseudomonadota bacterium]|nr:enoyl-CoA hydratase/isomerase family protein [Pseudomonadota bacterium]
MAATSGAAAPSTEILCELVNQVAIITLNRPAALNALSLPMIAGLRAQLSRCARDAGIRAVLLRGAGEKAFCAGGDVRALYRSFKEGGTLHRDFFIAEYALDYLLYSYPKPYIALMDGVTMGGGMGLAQGATLRIVGERTRIAMPEVGIGLFPDVGASYFLSRLPGSLGHYLALTGVPIDGADSVYARLADAYLAPSAIDSLAADFAALRWTDDNAADLRSLLQARSAPALPAASLSGLRPAIDRHFSQASVPGILASLEQESRPEYRGWALRTARLMRTRSPTLLCVTHRQLSMGRSLTLAGCFRMELAMVRQCFEQGDFIEGVRALLIDKDTTPRWSPSRLEDVTTASVDAFFQERWSGTTHPLADLERMSF